MERAVAGLFFTHNQKTRAIPASKQKSLFDYEGEAKRVIEFFESCTPSYIISQLLPGFFLAAYHTLVSHPIVGELPTLQFEMQVLGKVLTRTEWES